MTSKKPTLFFGCGCSPSIQPCGCVDPCATDTTITNDAYYALANSLTGQIIVIPLGSNAQGFLKGATEGLVYVNAQGVAQVSKAITLELPTHNPAAAGVVPVPTAFSSLMAGVGNDPRAWKFVLAPTTGEFVLSAKDGAWQLVESGQIPGLNTIFSNAPSASAVEIFGFVQTGINGLGQPVFQARKITASGTADLPAVFSWNAVNGRWEIKPVPSGTRVDRPLIGIRSIIGLDDAGVPIAGGFPIRANGAILANYSLMMYDSTTNRLFRAPALASGRKATNTDSANVADGGGFVSIADGRLSLAMTCNYSKAMVSFSTGLYDVSAENGTNLGCEFELRVDGVQHGLYGVVNSKFRSGTDIVSGLTPGFHTFEVFVKNLANLAGAFRLRSTIFSVQEMFS